MIERQVDFTTSLTGGFITKLQGKTPDLRFRFRYDGIGYETYVDTISNLSRTGNLPIGEILVTVMNTDGFWNTFISTEGEFTKTGSIEIYHAGDSEYMPLFTGEVMRATGIDEEMKMTLLIRDRLSAILDAPLGSANDLKDYTDAARTPAELVWKILTEEAGFDTTINQSNTDFDFGSWGAWQAATSANNLSFKALFYGNSIRSAIREILRMSQSFAWVTNEGKLAFEEKVNTSVAGDDTWTKEHILSNTPDPNIDHIINDQHIYYNYSTFAGGWESNHAHADFTSQGFYGVHPHTENTPIVWHNDLASATGAALWIDHLYDGKQVFTSVKVPWYGFRTQIGDIIDLTDADWGFSNDLFKVHEIEDINLDDYTITVKMLLKP